MKGKIIKRRNVYTSYGKAVETVVSLDEVVRVLHFFNVERRIDREEVKALLLAGHEIWTMNATYFLKGGKLDVKHKK